MNASRTLDSMPGPREPSAVQAVQRLRPGYYQRMADRYGPVYRLRVMGFGDLAIFATRSAAQQIVKLPPSVAHTGMDAGRKLPRMMMQKALGTGPEALLMLNEGEHLRMRKLLMPPLTGKRLTSWEAFIEQRTSQDIDSWPVGEPFAISPIVERIALDVMTNIAFGWSDNPKSRELKKLVLSLLKANASIVLGLVSPLGRMSLGGRTPWGRFQRERARIDEMIYAEIASRRRDSGHEHGDMLSGLVRGRDENGDPLADSVVRDQLVIMLLAGYQSTATAMAWAVERLTRNPKVLERLLVSLDDGDTTYLDAVVKEALRSRPIASDLTRLLTQEVEIDGWTLPAGVVVGLAIPVLHYDPAIYPEPEVFRPERFIGGDEPDPSVWLPFGFGSRRCPGASLGMMEMRVILATMLRQVRIAPDRPEPEKPTAHHLTMVPERGGQMIVTERLVPRPKLVS